MRKIALLLLVFMTTGCASGKWVWEMTEAEVERERLQSRRVQGAAAPQLHPFLQLLAGILRDLARSDWHFGVRAVGQGRPQEPGRLPVADAVTVESGSVGLFRSARFPPGLPTTRAPGSRGITATVAAILRRVAAERMT